MIYVLWSCSAASDVWGFETIKMTKWPNCFSSFWCLWKYMVDSLDQNELAMNAAILRQLRVKRNMMVFEKMLESPQSVVNKAKLLMENYHMARLLECLSSFYPATHSTRS